MELLTAQSHFVTFAVYGIAISAENFSHSYHIAMIQSWNMVIKGSYGQLCLVKLFRNLARLNEENK